MRLHSLALRAVIVSTLFVSAAPSALALALRPLPLPPISSSSASSVASTSSAASSSSSSSLIRPLQKLLLPPPGASSSSSTTSSSSTSSLKVKPPLPKGDLLDYCKAVKLTLQKGTTMPTPDASVVDQFNLSIDVLTKANALCESMLSTLGISSSSSSAASTASDTACVKTGTQKVGAMTLCKYMCGDKEKVAKCW